MAGKILVAGVGNRLMGDDGFGPRVIDLLAAAKLPKNIELRDIGTAGLTVATDLGDFDLVIFLDSVDMSGEPGRLIQTEVDVEGSMDDMAELTRVTLHEVGLEGLLRFAKAIGTLPSKVILVGCKPKSLDLGLELSPEVEEAAKKAASMVQDIVEKGSVER